MNVREIGVAFFDRLNRHDPLGASLVGLTAYDALLPDPRASADRDAARFFRATARSAESSPGDDIDRAVLTWMADTAADEAEHCLWEANASAMAYGSPQSSYFMAGRDHSLPGAAAFFDALADRYRDASGRGRPSTRAGLEQAATQLEAYPTGPRTSPQAFPPPTSANTPAGQQPTPTSGSTVQATSGSTGRSTGGFAGQQSTPAGAPAGPEPVSGDAATGRRPIPDDVAAAMRRLLAAYRGDLAEVARDDEHVGISAVRGGEAGYLAAVAAHTTLPVTPRQVHELGRELLADLESQWSALGKEAFGIGDPAAVRAHLRDEPSLRFTSGDEILATVAAALERASARTADITAIAASAPCAVEEVPAEEAESAPAAYYWPPAVDGSQPGKVFILTADPGQRSRFGLEALTFHEAVPGHHFQAVATQGLTELPDFRRYVDTRLGAYVEGWALYAEQLADELDLYSSPLTRLGRVSLAALRAARLVTDTGLHAFGWSRQQARNFLTDNTVLSVRDVRQETDRYIAWPGQALAYSVGAREILRLRESARTALGSRFDLVAFHDQVLGAGAVPMPVLATIINRWTSR
ncbi:DUF885 domain-containing protein [Actinoplanes sp. G11-F43]|uniref:DUF885 domain-containing protein n=1 Tax=Actinoplanes sp. G11-F43 TaxID=3424130 RepID=UPI003D35013C